MVAHEYIAAGPLALVVVFAVNCILELGTKALCILGSRSHVPVKHACVARADEASLSPAFGCLKD